MLWTKYDRIIFKNYVIETFYSWSIAESLL